MKVVVAKLKHDVAALVHKETIKLPGEVIVYQAYCSRLNMANTGIIYGQDWGIKRMGSTHLTSNSEIVNNGIVSITIGLSIFAVNKGLLSACNKIQSRESECSE